MEEREREGEKEMDNMGCGSNYCHHSSQPKLEPELSTAQFSRSSHVVSVYKYGDKKEWMTKDESAPKRLKIPSLRRPNPRSFGGWSETFSSTRKCRRPPPGLLEPSPGTCGTCP